MIDLSDWIWVLVAVGWLALRVVGRLYRSQARKARPIEDRHEQLDAAESKELGGTGPPPIAPR